ncbi:MAG: sigma 54-interacting transcriptional regulator [Vicinamibacteraceae bacterium]|nr:sigma 54-interacting transcriptional regulator [Vicinamibacteraceae bacterium]
MTLSNLHLSDVLEFSPDEGQIRFHEQRVVLLSAAALGLLRKELVATLGAESARRLLLRFGFADGYHDAVSLRDHLNWRQPIEGIRAAPSLYILEGLVHARFSSLAFDPAHPSAFEAEQVWRHSYEAEQHLHHYGRDSSPVCWWLTGYSSGYMSACVGEEVYFVETACAGAGARECRVSGRHAEGWGADLERLRFDFRSADLAADLDRLRKEVHAERRRLRRRERELSDQARELDLLRERVVRHARSRRFVLASAAMREVLELAARVAPLDTTVLVGGESGTGKEFVVRMIHEQSARARGPLVSVNCAALTETLLESELFGHVRGAFTGAVRDKAGLFEVASEGTLFLDEVGEMTPALQAKLLRALQEKEIRRVGGERSIRVNARVVAATNRDLRAEVAAGRFREDLFFRLGAFVITVPPLRDRREAIPALAHEFVNRAATQYKKPIQGITPAAMTALAGYSWPGNVRELENAMARAVILASGPRIAPADLPPEVQAYRHVVAARGGSRGTADASDEEGGEAGAFDLARHERELIRRALARYRGSRKRTAAALNISPVTLWRKMKQYKIADEADDER